MLDDYTNAEDIANLGIIGATGRAGSLILAEAEQRGHEVVAVLRQVADMLAAFPDVTWTYLTPAIEFQPDGPRTGTYRTGGDVVLRDGQGRSQISYADYAIALIDEIEQRRHVNQLFTVAA